MLADLYLPKLLNDMKIAVQKNHLVGQILDRRNFGYFSRYAPKKKLCLVPSTKKRRLSEKTILRNFL